jgi:hypothetical protein
MARKITVELTANARQFNNSIDSAIGKVTGLKGRIAATGGGSLTKGLAIGAGIASFNLITTAIEATVSQLDMLHQAYLDDEASRQRLDNALKNNVSNYADATAAAEKFASAQADLGFQDDDVRAGLEQLVGVTHDAQKAIELFGLAEDLSRAKNIDIATAVDAVTKGYLGQGRALQALGIDLRGAGSGGEILARTLKDVKGEAVAYAKTSAGLVAKENAKMQETFEKLGKAVDVVSQIAIPIMQAGLGGIVDAAGELIAWLTQAAGVLNDTFGPALRTIGDIARYVGGPLGTIADIAANIVGAIGGLGGKPAAGQTGGGQSTGFNPNGSPLPPGVSVVTYPWHHDGGMVAGPPGSDQLIMAQAGERIIPRGEAAGQTIIVNIASFTGSDRDIDRFSDRLAFRLRSTSLS